MGTNALIIELCDDLIAEQSDLHDLLSQISDSDWRRQTPAEGWRIIEQVAHLAFVDRRAATAVADPVEFERQRAEDVVSLTSFEERSLEWARDLDPSTLLAAWVQERTAFLEAVSHADYQVRIPWYGPPMSLASKVTARIMETWAHGQDIYDALGLTRVPTDRLRHVASIGVRTHKFSYQIRGRVVPEEQIWVELAAPSGELWTWGSKDTADRIVGSALDFCLVVTQRRHVDDTNLHVSGPAACEWMSIAQAFAGGPGSGRLSGQFRL